MNVPAEVILAEIQIVLSVRADDVVQRIKPEIAGGADQKWFNSE